MSVCPSSPFAECSKRQLPSNLEQRVVNTRPRVLSVISGACADNLADAVDRLLIVIKQTK